MHKLYELKEKLMNELEDYADNGKFSKDDVETIKYIASAVDHICNICEDVEGYSEAGDGMVMGGNYRGGGSYARGGRGGSYARGGRGGNRGGRRGGANQYGSYAMGGYSRASEELAMELRNLMKDAPNDQIRQEMQELVQTVEQM